ncbi:type II toxin-antitoxin system PemK/MazF family toxin [Polynucleobacter sp. AP-Titi-500A-B4]|uniref:type II toxin-antitoxin system PemK/MazF family toxin n=1 Tax=Polynucleobacter sp. AP-Titi-500A-B4 TaxID=2576923 RepID=UPI001BFE4D3E|nr:type II toxin-antitoxin system PemK/MazF family toxin [Polynucleobacter sp. AP-Titi-500A-B4]QWE13577.1 type II toxin-antitoxin system PemK/MazF family toxin [Polynucleobacter sp. AP-Titi-500A-B4]
MVSRGDIWLINLDPTKGSEIKKTRPCIIVSPQEMHDFLRTVIIAPMTTKGCQAPYRLPITHDGKKGLVLLDQISTIDKSRLVKRLGSVNNKLLGASLNILQAAFTL